jgi:hypothetical protein
MSNAGADLIAIDLLRMDISALASYVITTPRYIHRQPRRVFRPRRVGLDSPVVDGEQRGADAPPAHLLRSKLPTFTLAQREHGGHTLHPCSPLSF